MNPYPHTWRELDELWTARRDLISDIAIMVLGQKEEEEEEDEFADMPPDVRAKLEKAQMSKAPRKQRPRQRPKRKKKKKKDSVSIAQTVSLFPNLGVPRHLLDKDEES